MTALQGYLKNPITEAIIDLRVEPRDGLALSDLESCWLGEKQRYPAKEKLDLTTAQVQVPGTGQPPFFSAGVEQIGFVFKSQDEKEIFQVHREGFTANRLAPYQGWEPFRREARRLWKVYQESILPRKVVRLALRYINRLDFPYPGVELKDYLNISPDVPPGLLQPLGNVFMQLAAKQEDIKAIVQLTQTALPSHAPGTTSMALDIDLYRTEAIPQDEEGIWGLFETLRKRKNEIFEVCITDRTRELIR